MERCAKCNKGLPKIGSMYIFSCYDSSIGTLCENCWNEHLAQLRIEGERKKKIKDETPNNGCCNCGTKEANFIFDDDRKEWLCEKCYYITKYGEEKWKEILANREKYSNEKRYGKLKLFLKEKQFIREPFTERYGFEDVISYELIENGAVERTGSLGGAIVGGAIAGSTGAIIGYDQGRKTKSICTEYRIIIRVRGKAPINIGYIGGGVSVPYNTQQFVGYRNDAYATIEGIEVILEETRKAKEKAQEITATNSNSIADEIIKLKSLLDQGIITEDEFSKGKEKLLEKI